jgi:DNA modification methylase
MIVHNPNNLPTAPIADLLPTQGDLKILTETNYKKLKNVILRRGFSYPVYVWEDKQGIKHLLDGHQRRQVLNNEGWDEPIPYLKVPAKDLQEAMARLLEITSQYATITQEGIDEFIATYELEEAEVYEATSFDALGKYGDDEDPEIEEDDPPEVNETDPPISKLGEIYQLGKHRIMCGSATSEDDTNLLLGEQQIDLYLTDPPYNVDYTGKTKDALKIDNDSMDDLEFLAFLTDSHRRADEHMKKGAAFYIFHADSEGYNFRSAVKAVDWMLKQCLIWVKQTMVMGRQDYQWKHEPIIYGWKSGASHAWYTDRKQTTVLEFDRPQRNAEHPTMKPLSIVGYLIKNSTKAGDLVFDNFIGSGSTLIAAEQTERICYGMELDPRYVDVIRKRYAMLMNDNDLPENWEELTPAINTGNIQA